MILDESDMHLLPPSIRWLVKAIGLTAALKLVSAHGGGTPIYVPIAAKQDHRLRGLIGDVGFAALVAEYGGNQLEIPRCNRALRVLTYRNIRRESAEGASQNTLALKYEYTVRHIREILDGDEMNSQQQLF
jgi:Mor transcription activator family